MSRARRAALAATAAALLAALPLAVRAAGLALTSAHLTTTATCALTAFPASSGVDIDTYAQQGSPTTTASGSNTLTVQTATTQNDRVYIKFDLTKCTFAIPSTAVVRTATLRLFMTAISSSCRTLDAFPVTAAWLDTTLTWNNQPFGTALNTPASSQRTAYADVGTPSTCANHTNNSYVGWLVTADVSGFVTGATTNSGWMIRDDVEGFTTTSAEKPSAIHAGNLPKSPQLIVTYTML